MGLVAKRQVRRPDGVLVEAEEGEQDSREV